MQSLGKLLSVPLGPYLKKLQLAASCFALFVGLVHKFNRCSWMTWCLAPLAGAGCAVFT